MLSSLIIQTYSLIFFTETRLHSDLIKKDIDIDIQVSYTEGPRITRILGLWKNRVMWN